MSDAAGETNSFFMSISTRASPPAASAVSAVHIIPAADTDANSFFVTTAVVLNDVLSIARVEILRFSVSSQSA